MEWNMSLTSSPTSAGSWHPRSEFAYDATFSNKLVGGLEGDRSNILPYMDLL